MDLHLKFNVMKEESLVIAFQHGAVKEDWVAYKLYIAFGEWRFIEVEMRNELTRLELSCNTVMLRELGVGKRMKGL